MADLDAIRLQDEQTRQAEQLVLSGVADYLEEAVRLLPENSQLCRPFLVCADRYRDIAGWPEPSAGDCLALLTMQKQLRHMDIAGDDD